MRDFITYKLRFLKNIFAVFIAESERSDQYKAKGGEQIPFAFKYANGMISLPQ